MFARIGVFAGSWLLESAEAVCAGDMAPAVERALLRTPTPAVDLRANPAATVPAAGTSAGADLDASPSLLSSIASLLDTSMLAQAGNGAGEHRFHMLTTVRTYACERLRASGEEWRLRNRHAQHFLDVAERAGPGLRGAAQGLWLALSWSRTTRTSVRPWGGRHRLRPRLTWADA